MSKRYVLGLLEESENIESFREQMINAIKGYSFTVARAQVRNDRPATERSRKDRNRVKSHTAGEPAL